MAKVGNLTLNIDLEPSEQTKQFVRSVVVEVLKDVLASAAFGEDISKIVDQALTRHLENLTRQSKMFTPIGGVR